MALRVAIGFLAVAITVVVANIATQRSAREAREKVRELLIQHEPLVRAIESLSAAVSLYERVVIDQSETSAIAQQPVKAAAQRMTDAANDYAEAASRFDELDRPASAFHAELSNFRKAGEDLLSSSAARRARMRDYWTRFDTLEASLNAPQAKAVRFAGAVFASEKLMDLARTLAGIREQVSAAASLSSPRSAQLIIGSENAFRSSLQLHSAELAKLHGQAWFEQVKTNFNAVVTGRRAAFQSIDTFNEQSVMFRDRAADISGMIVTQLVEPARRALANADRLAVQASDRADRHLGWASGATLLLLLIIAVATVTGVTAPVRRLTEATRRLAAGAVRTRVVRGGVRELDTLAEAFNQMAEQLQQAQNAVRVHQLELEARVDERTRELNHLAHHDPLTDLPNRRHLLAHLEEALDRARLRNGRLALLFIDLDNFKTINDSMGHAFGDRVLQAVSERLRMNSLFSRSFSARLGGDEFTVVCEEVNQLGDVERLARSVLEEFQRSLSVHGRELRISVSVGACVFPDHASDSHALLRAADSALFRSKELGRNCWSLYAPQLLEAAASRFKVEQSLRRAVERGEFELLYQPEVCFETLETHTVEALLRWRQPDGNVVSPADFFTVAEQTGLITDISDWALRTAIQTAAVWHHGPWPKARVAVNVSSQQLLSPSFVSRLQALLQQHRLPAQCLELELTENILQTGANTIATLKRLRELGVSIALDDFGTGYSSLTSLERLPLTRVKIDRSLVTTVDTGGRSPAIVRSIIGLCHSLGLQVTAEGVERPSQLGVLLTDRGVQVQGYLVSRPINAATVPVFIDQARAHLEHLMIAAPPPAVDADNNTTRLRTLRASSARGARPARAPADEK
ncbi:putative bifunctional diguanylate cyclase/phosphodiesterase [Steroidobacter sp.]|uniref:putative bifunctional diguanylate cyclase/phosphodiesterase n=1 Tax=Steroidobacter sp. TaxID=1978227 RepID=UPI001A62B001|nr:EAL domain-containing protein [Steroidobacter sp.]MBL8266508.1 EAL domain-containing protein [Steroidobacter sp.]